MTRPSRSALLLATSLIALGPLSACGDTEADDDAPETAVVTLENAFQNAEGMGPKWTICEAWYNGTRFETALAPGESTEPTEVEPGLSWVLMTAAWDDPTCADEATQVILSTAQQEETVPGQARTIQLTAPNHRGPCPPEGVPPITEAAWNEALEVFADYDFPPYADRATIAGCAS